MRTFSLRLTPRSAFGTPPRGDTLFGQLCWMMLRRRGRMRLTERLVGYTEDRPFAVVSDAMPAGYVPRPQLPLSRLGDVDVEQRKALKARTWLPVASISDPTKWLEESRSIKTAKQRSQPHNSINRLTGMTGSGAFAPYQMDQLWYTEASMLDCHVVYDPDRIDDAEIAELFADIGNVGFGRDASIGLGRFDVDRGDRTLSTSDATANAYLTLAPCVPQGGAWRSEQCFYRPFTRFGRHGAEAALQSGSPFKTPVLMADSGAVLAPLKFTARAFVGRGLGGDASLSRSIPETVHQGYAPVIGIRLAHAEVAR